MHYLIGGGATKMVFLFTTALPTDQLESAGAIYATALCSLSHYGTGGDERSLL